MRRMTGGRAMAEALRVEGVEHVFGIVGPLTSFAARASQVSDIPGIVREAIRVLRCQRPRPAYIEVPLDVSASEGEVELLPPDKLDPAGGNPAAVERGAQLLRQARRPNIYAGSRVARSGASDH